MTGPPSGGWVRVAAPGRRTSGCSLAERVWFTGKRCTPAMRAGALAQQDILGDADLLFARSLVRHAVAAVGGPGRRRELQAAVVTVTGVDRPVATALASSNSIPVVAGGRCVGGRQTEGAPQPVRR